MRFERGVVTPNAASARVRPRSVQSSAVPAQAAENLFVLVERASVDPQFHSTLILA